MQLTTSSDLTSLDEMIPKNGFTVIIGTLSQEYSFPSIASFDLYEDLEEFLTVISTEIPVSEFNNWSSYQKENELYSSSDEGNKTFVHVFNLNKDQHGSLKKTLGK